MISNNSIFLKTIFIFYMLGVLGVTNVFASNIAIFPKSIEIIATSNEELKSEFLIVNPSDEEISYDFFVQYNAEVVKIFPPSFILGSDESQKVLVEINSKNRDIHQASIVISSKPKDSSSIYESEITEIIIDIETTIKSNTALDNRVNMAGLYGLYDTNYVFFLIPLLLILNISLFVVKIVYGKKTNTDKIHRF